MKSSFSISYNNAENKNLKVERLLYERKWIRGPRGTIRGFIVGMCEEVHEIYRLMVCWGECLLVLFEYWINLMIDSENLVVLSLKLIKI